MPTSAELEASTESSEPREYFTITINEVETHNHTSGSRDLFIDGTRYTALSMERSEQAITMPGKETEMTLTLPVNHAAVRRYLRQATPPKRMRVQAWRTQVLATTETTIQVWDGDATSINVDRAVAKFLVPSRAAKWLLRSLPDVHVSKDCPHILYSTRCGVSRDGSGPSGLAHKAVTTVWSTSGREVVVNLLSTDRNGTWALDGELLHVSSNERMTVIRQIDVAPGTNGYARLYLQAPIAGLKLGDTVHVFAGCEHTINGPGGCTPKFNNRGNYGGSPHLPSANLFVPGSYKGWLGP